jgi:hypothetical protein
VRSRSGIPTNAHVIPSANQPAAISHRAPSSEAWRAIREPKALKMLVIQKVPQLPASARPLQLPQRLAFSLNTSRCVLRSLRLEGGN